MTVFETFCVSSEFGGATRACAGSGVLNFWETCASPRPLPPKK